MNEPSPGHPRPQLRREQWIDLCGEWEFAFDDDDRGLPEHWQEQDARSRTPFDRVINVPFAWQAPLSGVEADPNAVHDVVWYRLELKDLALSQRQRLLVHFEAVDYEATAWLNGRLVASHRGGQTPFEADVTDALGSGPDTLVLRARDYALDPSLPRGKQAWRPVPSGIHYTRSTGIHGPVWAEIVDRLHVESVRMTPNLETGSLELTAKLAGAQAGARLRATATIDAQEAGTASVVLGSGSEASISIALSPLVLWEPAPGRPALYDLALEVLDADGAVRDRAITYFGMRRVEVVDGRVLINGTERFLRGVLDQRWDRDGLLTPADPRMLRGEVELALACGFNFVRIHQKREDLRYYAWADRLGLMVSGEAANAFQFTPTYVERMTAEWTEVVRTLHNSPSVILWLPINESWGCRSLRGGEFQAHHATAMYELTKSLDPTRPCASNDGWEHTRSDFTGVHDYGGVVALRELIRQLRELGGVERLTVGSGAPVYVNGYRASGSAVICTEFGGLFRGASPAEIGYAVYGDDEEFHARLRELIATLVVEPKVAGFVYTQWKDVETETNGLLDADGRLKWELERIREAVTQPRPEPSS